MTHDLPPEDDVTAQTLAPVRVDAASLSRDTAQRMRIVLITHFFPAHRGGVELVAGHLAETLVRNAAAVIEWFASDCDPAPVIEGITCVSVPAWNPLERRWHLPYPFWSPLRLKALWNAVRRADLVHIHDYIYVGSIATFAIAKIQRKPILITQHVGAVPFRNMMVRRLLALANMTLGRAMLEYADGAAFVSSVVRQFFLPGETSERRGCLIQNGLDRSTFFPVADAERDRLRAGLNIPAGRTCFLFVGRFVEKKGLDLLERLTESLPDVIWIFAGKGEMDPEKWARSNVRIFRDRSGSTLAELYRAADLLVLPSAGEGFPLVVQESMACGTPAIVGRDTASALPGVEQMLFSETVTAGDALPAWHRRLTTLAADPPVLARRRSEVADWAATHWSWDRCANTYRDLILTILEQQR
ncbi:glycosyltransferase family 4 protein [Burkholderia sp. A9]|uniref:glycosyltransferase family 4 protein n=1 Tax=Burkholderia sp. A9 TaxID=1365108 RepID=UPI00069503CD|nr:glycosyltransferase family 4 protein [Burkholderia sp. A9]